MDYNAMLSTIFEGLVKMAVQFWYVLSFMIFIAVLKTSWFKGKVGELLVNFLLNRFLDKQHYQLIKNVTLPTEDGTTQIDHIVVSQFGIFVVETKNMKGWIFGTAKQKQWTQKIFKYTGKFQNPLHQNYKHTQTLAACLNVPSDSIHSVIVFIGDSTFKTKMPENVTYARGCIKYIKTNKVILFTSEQVAEIVAVIEAGRLSRSLKTNLQHNKHVKETVAGKQVTEKVELEPVTIDKEASEPVCAKCGSAMVLREAKKGKNAGNQFWGCTGFPKCREMVNVS